MTKLRILIVITLLSATVLAERTKLKPATSEPPQKDIELGQAYAKDAEKELTLINNPTANGYISALGTSLVAKAPNPSQFPFTFKIVDDRSINAFALPGGPIYVHRGAIEAADNEAQIAGVIGHEAGHVILRHGMAQAIKAQRTQLLVGGLSAILGDSTAGQLAAGLGGFAANSVLLRYSRDAESQADLMGTQILFDSGYDPIAMVEFFDKLAREDKGSKTEQFFSNHPIPVNRIAKVSDEIKRIGPVPANPRKDTAEFRKVKQLLLAMPEPPKPAVAAADSASKTSGSAIPAPPSSRMTDLQVSGIRLRYPENWKPTVQGSNVTLAPAGGVAGSGDLAYGMIIDLFMPQNVRTLDQATGQFIDRLRMGNPDIRIVRSRLQGQLGNRPAQLTELSNQSPAGGQESDIVVTVLQANGTLRYFIEVAPAKDMPQYQTAFRAILDSVRFQE